MQNLADEYTSLTSRMGRLREQRAVLEAREAEKERQRTQLQEELTLLGVDVSNPAGEIARLEAEANDDLNQAREQVNQFERDLNAATSPQIQEPPPQTAAVQPPAKPEPKSDGLPDLEIA